MGKRFRSPSSIRTLVLSATAALLLATQVSAQSITGFHGPNLNIGRITPNVINPNIHLSPNVTTDGSAASPPRVSTSGDTSSGGSGRKTKKKTTSTMQDDPFVAKEVVVEFDAVISEERANAIGRQHRLVRLETISLPLIGSTLVRWRIPDSRSVGAVVKELGGDVKSVQPNYRFTLQQDGGATEGDAAQYALVKLHLPQAHALTRGEDVVVAVIDSGIDAAHPEFAGAVSERFDAAGGDKEPVHVHGTGIAGVIVSHAKLMGGAPAAKILAIRAFGPVPQGIESTSFVLAKSLDFAIVHGARVVNMSFAGPQDPLLAKALSVAAGKGVVLVAASGNAGAKSPPLFPAADGHVIAVSGANANDELFVPSNRGAYVALCAPATDILTAAPGGKYQVISGTSFAAAYVSSVAALALARNPVLVPSEVRDILVRTARDLGAPGWDDQFGAGEVDALAAVTAAAAPVATAADRPASSPETTAPR